MSFASFVSTWLDLVRKAVGHPPATNPHELSTDPAFHGTRALATTGNGPLARLGSIHDVNPPPFVSVRSKIPGPGGIVNADVVSTTRGGAGVMIMDGPPLPPPPAPPADVDPDANAHATEGALVNVGQDVLQGAALGAKAGPYGAVAGAAVGLGYGVSQNADNLDKTSGGTVLVDVVEPWHNANSVGDVALNMLVPFHALLGGGKRADDGDRAHRE